MGVRVSSAQILKVASGCTAVGSGVSVGGGGGGVAVGGAFVGVGLGVGVGVAAGAQALKASVRTRANTRVTDSFVFILILQSILNRVHRMRLGFPDAKNQMSRANPSEAYISDLSILITSLSQSVRDQLRDEGLV
jgi:hypothetical protein